MTTLAVGDKAPAFTLKDQNGKEVKLSGAKGQKVIVYFYPRPTRPDARSSRATCATPSRS